jgi:3-oxoacyl-[acyl-carrier protein] reductase
MEREFEGKAALITGASRGIGRAAAIRLAKGGCKIALAYASNDAAANEAKALCEQAGSPLVSLCKFDVADAAACAKGIEDAIAALGGLNILVNNAGVAVDGLILRYKPADLEKTLQTNLASAFHLSKAAAKAMLRTGGAIVNITSVVGEMGNAGQTAYSMAKAGLIGLTKSLARELGSRNIRVNAVSPGFVETDMTKELPGAAKAAMVQSTPLGRIGTADEIAEAIAFLAGPRATFITGEVLRVNGGLYM